jgi:hypothetical protein
MHEKDMVVVSGSFMHLLASGSLMYWCNNENQCLLLCRYRQVVLKENWYVSAKLHGITFRTVLCIVMSFNLTSLSDICTFGFQFLYVYVRDVTHECHAFLFWDLRDHHCEEIA